MTAQDGDGEPLDYIICGICGVRQRDVINDAALPYLAPAGDGGLREALEAAARDKIAEWYGSEWNASEDKFYETYDGGGISCVDEEAMLELRGVRLALDLALAAHPATPAVPQPASEATPELTSRPVDREALLDRDAVENAIATKAMYYDSGTAVHEVDDGDIAGLVAATDAIMQLVRPAPTFGQVKAAIRTGLGGDTEDEACGCESHICSAADAVLAVLAGGEGS